MPREYVNALKGRLQVGWKNDCPLVSIKIETDDGNPWLDLPDEASINRLIHLLERARERAWMLR